MAAPLAPAPAEFSLAVLQTRCGELESHIEARQLATAEELDPRRPGGADNKDDNWWGWIRWYGFLCQFVAREAGGGDLDFEDADLIVADALRSEPLEIKLHSPGDDPQEQPRRLVKVYPKSFDTLLVNHARSLRLGWLAERRWAVEMAGIHATGRDMSLIERLDAEVSYQYQLLAWTVTTPGPGMPFDPRGEEQPKVPEWIERLPPEDWLLLANAFAAVNAKRLKVMEILLSRSEQGEGARPSWSIFISHMAKQLKVGSRYLMRDYALAELMAMAYLGAPESPVEAASGVDEEVLSASD